MLGSPSTRTALGLLVIAAMVAFVVFVGMAFSGRFADEITVDASIAQVGDSLRVGDTVSYREILVGTVRDFEPNGNGGARLELRIERRFADRIPSDVTAIGVPTDLFGKTNVLLSDSATPSRDHLVAGDRIAANTDPAAAGLQTALSDIYDLLNAVEPAQLNAALSAVDEALSGRGQDLNRLIADSSDYLGELVQHRDEIARLIENIATTVPRLAEAAPDLVASIDHLLAPARVIANRRAAIDELLTVAPQTIDRFTDLTQAVGNDTIVILQRENAVLRLLAKDPSRLTDALLGLGDLGRTFSSVIKDGKLQLNAVVTGINTSALLPLSLGRPSTVLDSVTDPTTYSGQDTRAARAATTSMAEALSSSAGGTSGNVGTATETDALRDIAEALGNTGSTAPEKSPAQATDEPAAGDGLLGVLLGPLVRGSAVSVP